MSADVRVVAHWDAAPGHVDAVRRIARDLAERSLREPGCLTFDVLEAVREPGRLLLLETYADDTARRAHTDSGHFRELVLEQAVPLLARREVETYRPLGEKEASHGRTQGR